MYSESPKAAKFTDNIAVTYDVGVFSQSLI